MSTPSLLTFAVASFALLIAPGPNVLFIITQAASHGRKAGFMCVLGGVTGMLVLTGLVAVGLAGLLAASPIAFNIVKWFGAAYLIYIGIRTLLDRNAIRFDRSAERASLSKLYSQGLITALLNPKLAIFFAAFLPQFVDPNGGSVALQIVLLGLIFSAIGLTSDSGYALLAGSAGDWLRRQPAAIKALRWVSGSVFIGLGLRLAIEEQR
jgi:threonine/homoserine/homoserine lactone efflux protein